MALTYERNKNFPVDPRLNAVQFRKRTAGRPKKRGLALTRDPVPEEGLPGPSRGRGQPGGGGARGMLPGRARVRGGLPGQARVRGGLPGGARVRGGPLRRARVRGGLVGGARGRGVLVGDGDGDGRLENTVVVPRNVWSSLNVLGNIELNDPGEEEEEDENGEGVSSQEEGVSSQEEGVSSQEEEDESLAEQPEEMDWDLDI